MEWGGRQFLLLIVSVHVATSLPSSQTCWLFCYFDSCAYGCFNFILSLLSHTSVILSQSFQLSGPNCNTRTDYFTAISMSKAARAPRKLLTNITQIINKDVWINFWDLVKKRQVNKTRVLCSSKTCDFFFQCFFLPFPSRIRGEGFDLDCSSFYKLLFRMVFPSTSGLPDCI